MLGISIIVLALGAAGQTVGDDHGQIGKLPFEITNPSRVRGGELYQSDMLLTEGQRAALKKRKAINNEQMRWTEGPDGNPLVPYIFQDTVNQTDVRAGLDHWMEHTCINFEETNITDQTHLQFHIGTGCWSNVGMVYWKRDINGNYDDENGQHGQQISIGNNCNELGTVVHEVGHAMGFHHEQSRSDRDDYVTVLMDNVLSGRENNFDKEADNNYSIQYDYSSNMHYGMDYFTKNNLPTIVTLDPLAQELIGSRNGLTHRDKLLANRMYNCTGKWLDKCKISSELCLNDGYTGMDCTCVCPTGTNGSYCENVVDEYYAPLRNPLSEKITTEKSISVETPMEAGTKFIKWIVPPTFQKAKLTFTSADFYSDCQYQYLNVKTNSSDLVGQAMCGADISAGVTLTSETGIIITMINHVTYSFKKTLWTADVIFENISGCSTTDPPSEPSTELSTEPPTESSTETPPTSQTDPTTELSTVNSAKPLTEPPTETTTQPPTKPPTTTKVSIAACPCEKKLSKAVESITIRSFDFLSEYSAANCGWEIQAAKEKKLHITCENTTININKFARDNTASSMKFNIQFSSEL